MRLSFLLGLVLLASACNVDTTTEPKPPQRSNTLQLNQINGSNGAFSSDGQKLEVFVAMLGPDGFVQLGDGDAITVEVNGNAVPTRERVEDGKVHYIAEVAPPPTEPVVVTRFTRASGGEAVGKNALAPAFTLKSPPTAAKTGDAIDLDIEPRPDAARAAKILHRLKVTGECIEKGEKVLDVPSTYPMSLSFRNVQVVGDAGCKVEVTVRLETDGEPFTGFKGGGFEGVQSRSFELTLSK